MVIRITSKASCDAAKTRFGKQTDIPDEKVSGLALRVTALGKKSWTFRYRDISAKQKRVGFGSYPAVSLAAARTAAYEALASIASGDDPASQKKAARAAAKAKRASTVTDLIEEYLAACTEGRHKPNGGPKRASTIALDRYYSERFIKPVIGNYAIADLSRADVQKLMNDAGKTGESNARHCRNVIRQAYNYAIRRETVEKNPAQLAELMASKSRERVLSDKELKSIWQASRDSAALAKYRIEPATGLAICLAMVTLQRGGEVCGIHAREIDREAKLWVIPGERTKNHRTQAVPLSKLALDVIDAAYALGIDNAGFAFPSRISGRSLTRRAVSRAMKRITAGLKIPDATPHDFRRTGATNITGERIGIPRFIVSRVLNQMSDTGGAALVTGVYDRNEYLPEKRRALDAWASILEDILTPK